jgi:hypothetical protein
MDDDASGYMAWGIAELSLGFDFRPRASATYQ